MIDLEEIELIEPAEIAAVEENAKRLPEGIEPESPDELYQALESFRGAIYASLIAQFSMLTSYYLQFQSQLEDVKRLGVTAQSAPILKPAAERMAEVINNVRTKVEAAAGAFTDDSAAVVENMASLLRRMHDNADLLLRACDEAVLTGNREFRRSLRKRKDAVGHALKGPKRKPRPKPKG